MKVCKRCKKELPEGSSFCPYCGKSTEPKKRRSRRPNGSGSVCKVSGKRQRPWLARIQIGEERRTVGYYQTESEALRALVMYDPNESAIHKEMTLKEVWEIVSKRKESAITISSQKVRSLCFNKLKPLWDKDVSKLHTEDYQKLLDSLAKELSTGTLTHIRSIISEIGKWCVANDILRFNPSEYLTTPKGKDKKVDEKDKIFSEREIDLLWQDDSEDARIILTMIYTGLRINELLSLKPSDIHLGDNYNYLIGGEKTEAGKNRIVMIHPRLIPFFQSWLSTNHEYLIVNRDGNKINSDHWRDKHYYKLLDKLGIHHISPHKARHTFATRIAAAGGNITALQKTIGHANYSTTANIYTHPDMDSLKKLIELLK